MSGLSMFLRAVDPGTCESLADGPTSAEAFFAARDTGTPLPDRIVVGTSPDGDVRRFAIHQPNQGDVFVDLDRGLVHKRVTRFAEFDVAEREVGWLDALADSGWTPVVRHHDDRLIVTDYLGEPLRHTNLPDDWQLQADSILDALTAAGCSHNDIKCDNLVVADGRLALIDFGWSTPLGAPIPPHWPEGIGRQHRLGVHRFDDRHAIRAACRSAADDRVVLSRAMSATRSVDA